MCDGGHRVRFRFNETSRLPKRVKLGSEKEVVMKEYLTCKFCGSDNQRKFIGDMSLRPPGLKYIDTSPVVLAPEVYVCLDCCTAELVVPESELRLLAQQYADATELTLCGGYCRDRELSL
jgi:hypothetical protein